MTRAFLGKSMGVLVCIGLAVAGGVIVGCGHETVATGCSPATCDGCCDASGVCRAGTSCAGPGCGDGVKQSAEECDGTDLGGAGCESLGLAGGPVACTADCRLDTTACSALTCSLAAETPERYPFPCQICSPDGGALVSCGFCREIAPGVHPDDQVSPCDAGETCYTWHDAVEDRTVTACLAAPPELCTPDAIEGVCDGETATLCVAGRIERYDCAARSQRCVVTTTEFGTFPTCVDPTAAPCDPDLFAERCEGDARVVCAATTFYEERERCDAGTTCVAAGTGSRCLPADWSPCDPGAFVADCDGEALVTCEPIDLANPEAGGYRAASACTDGFVCGVTSIGGLCVPRGTHACDAETYVSHCDADLLFECHRVRGWEVVNDCSGVGDAGVMTCQPFGAVPACAPRDYVACDPAHDFPRCDGGTAIRCEYPGWIAAVECSGDNPICRTSGGGGVGCTFDGAAPCTFDVTRADVQRDRFGRIVHARPLRCRDGRTLVVCDEMLQLEQVRTCPTGISCVTAPMAYPQYDAYCGGG